MDANGIEAKLGRYGLNEALGLYSTLESPSATINDTGELSR